MLHLHDPPLARQQSVDGDIAFERGIKHDGPSGLADHVTAPAETPYPPADVFSSGAGDSRAALHPELAHDVLGLTPGHQSRAHRRGETLVAAAPTQVDPDRAVPAADEGVPGRGVDLCEPDFRVCFGHGPKVSKLRLDGGLPVGGQGRLQT